MELKINVPGKSQAQERPRFHSFVAKDGRSFVQTYDPKNSKKYKNDVKDAAIKSIKEQGWTYTDLPIEVEIIVYKELTKTQRGSKKFMKQFEQGAVRPTTKPDLDNLAKGVLDALSKIVYRDDNQIIRLIVSKYFTASEPYVEIIIKTWGW